jgi:HlyD family secretion protein
MTWWKALIALAIVAGLAAITVAGLRERPVPPIEVQLGAARRRVTPGLGDRRQVEVQQ